MHVSRLYFQWMSGVRDGQKRKDERRTIREVSPTILHVNP